jgi:hypothetical protein
MKKLFIFFACILIPFSANAQWSNNPLINTTICNVNGMQLLPKVAATPDGGSYISWFDGRSGNLDVYIQRLDVNGVNQFAANGLLVSSHPQNSWIGEYDLISDANNNAILVFSDKRNSTTDTIINPFAYKISPAGSFLWGANGVALSNTSASYQMWPKAAISSDGGIFVTWWMAMGDNSGVYVQKLSDGGVLQWAAPLIFTPVVMTKYLYPDIVGSDNGSAIVSWVSGPIDTTGSFIPDLKTIQSAKVASGGTVSWTKDVFTRNEPTIPPYVVPRIYSDGNNGAYFSWFFGITFQRVTSAYSHISPSGNYLLADTFAIVSTNNNGMQFEPDITFNPSNGDVYSFWTESNLGQQVWGLYGQRFNSSGVRMWSDTGKAIVPLGVPQQFYISANFYNGNVTVGYEEALTGVIQHIKSFSINPDGNLVWGINFVSNAPSAKEQLVSSMTSSGMTVYAWEDNRGLAPNQSDIYAQNVKPDGTLGPVGINTISSNVPEKFKLMQNYPNPFNPSTTIRFDISKAEYVTLKIYDVTGKKIAELINETLNPGEYNYNLQTAEFNLSTGVYLYTITAGNFTDTKRMLLLK